MLFNLQPEYLGDNLVELRPLTGSEFAALYKVASDPLIWEIHPAPDRYKEEVFKVFFDGAVASKSSFLIYEKASGELMGTSRFYDYKPEEGSIAIGYTFLARKYWGGTYNFSLKKLMLEYAFQKVDRVLFHIGVTNFRSQKAIQKLGAVKVRAFMFESSPSSSPSPYFEFEIKREAWKV